MCVTSCVGLKRTKKNTGQITILENSCGFSVVFNQRKYNLVFPKQHWSVLPTRLKQYYLQEFGFISTVSMPLVSRFERLMYNTPQPLCEDEVKDIILHQIPGVADDYNLDTKRTIDRFNAIQYDFTGQTSTEGEADAHDGGVLLLSCGKDSLLTLGIGRELGIDLTPVHINDTTTPHENKVSLATMKKIEQTTGIAVEIVTNHIEKLNDFEEWNTPPSCLGYSHMITGFCFLAVPFLHSSGSVVLLGNQQNMNFSFHTRDGYVGYPSYDQTTTARHQQQTMLQQLNPNYRVMSLIEPLTDLAEMKILFSRYPELARYEFSCNCLYGTNEKRWCHECNKCARLSLFMHAHNIDIKKVGLRSMLSRQFMQYYALFGRSPGVDRYEKSKEARDQQLLAFYMAYKNGVRGHLIDLFKREYLAEAVEREDELRKTFFGVYDTEVPPYLRTPLSSLYSEELRDLR